MTWVKDAQLTTGFVDQLYNVICATEVMAQGEAKTFKRLNLFKWITMEIDRWVI